MKRLAVTLLALACLLGATARADESNAPSAAEAKRMERLRAGEVLVEPAGPGQPRERVVALVHAPWERLWAGLTDHNLLFRIFPDQGDARVKESEPDHDVLCYTQKHFLTLRFCIRRGIDRGARRIRWEGADGDLKSAAGGWEFAPIDDGRATLVTFSNDVETAMWVPRWAVRRYNRTEMVRTVGYLRPWAETGRFPGEAAGGAASP